jgi:stage II sporulation protein GA (sporulation sigma-E factor processing peptidase)
MLEYEIYADVVFLINLAMDMLIFYFTGKIAQRKTTLLKLFLGSFTAASLYCLLVFVPGLKVYYNFFTTLAILMAGLLIAFNPKSVIVMLKLTIIANIAAFAVGGAAFAIFYYSNISGLIGNVIFTTNNLPLTILIAATAASYIIIKLIYLRLNSVPIRQYFGLIIYANNKKTNVTALMDTGNLLTDPLTKEPVVIAEFDAVKELLPENIRDIYLKKRHDELLELMNAFSQTDFIKRVRILPYMSLGKENGMLIGFKPDYVHIIELDTNDTTEKEVIIGIYNFRLSDDGSFGALLNPSIIRS